MKKGEKWTITKATLDQNVCVYEPHVVKLPAGGALDVLNSDGILHNIHTYSKANPSINKAQPKFKKVLTEKFAKPEIIKVTCDAHSWMLGWIVVSDHPYVAVTNDKGEFTLNNVPPGTYKLEVWQETLGKKVQDVVVKAKQETKVNVEPRKVAVATNLSIHRFVNPPPVPSPSRGRFGEGVLLSVCSIWGYSSTHGGENGDRQEIHLLLRKGSGGRQGGAEESFGRQGGKPS
ncbi:MAG: carboxypeptidase regulatory-like domain-containing protein [Candidatus Methylomirabilis sp.]|nr:carboxypeptidase regulatory-like domain-containing protein [Candidatus Methylomirabilis sp.]